MSLAVSMRRAYIRPISLRNFANEKAYPDSDFSIMDKTVRLAKENGVRVGAHPSLPDRQGFGRREMAIEPVCLLS